MEEWSGANSRRLLDTLDTLDSLEVVGVMVVRATDNKLC